MLEPGVLASEAALIEKGASAVCTFPESLDVGRVVSSARRDRPFGPASFPRGSFALAHRLCQMRLRHLKPSAARLQSLHLEPANPIPRNRGARAPLKSSVQRLHGAQSKLRRLET